MISRSDRQAFALAFSGLVGLVFAAMLTWYGYGLVERSVTIGQVSSAMQAPMWLIYSILPFGGALLAFRCMEFIANALTQDTMPTQSLVGEDGASPRDIEWKGGI